MCAPSNNEIFVEKTLYKVNVEKMFRKKTIENRLIRIRNFQESNKQNIS